MKASHALLLLIAACGGSAASSQPTTPPSAAAALSCEQVVGHIRELALVASGANTDAQKTAALREIDPALVEVADECEAPETQWTQVFRRCIAAAADRDGVRRCDAQNQAAPPKPSPLAP